MCLGLIDFHTIFDEKQLHRQYKGKIKPKTIKKRTHTGTTVRSAMKGHLTREDSMGRAPTGSQQLMAAATIPSTRSNESLQNLKQIIYQLGIFVMII
jgi:hypothetical protein